MLDYFNTYKKFLKSKSCGNMTKAEGHVKGLEIHHVLPKARGEMSTEENKVWLSEFDHCMAHALLQIAMIQRGEEPFFYSFRHCFTYGDKNLLTYWNPISKLKIKITSQDGQVEILMISDAMKKIIELQNGRNTNLPKGWKPKQRRKNEVLKRLLEKVCVGKHMYFGFKWEIAA